MKKQKELIENAKYVRNGGDLRKFNASDVLALQEYALTIGDVDLYDHLETFWI